MARSLRGAGAGIYFAFAMFGIKTGVVVVSGSTVFSFGVVFLPIPAVLVPIVVVVVATRHSLDRIARGRTNAIAFVVKFALVSATAYWLASLLLSIGDGNLSIDSPGLGGSDKFVALVSAANAFFFVFLIVGLASIAVVLNRYSLPLPDDARRIIRNVGDALRTGGAAFGLLCLMLGVVLTVAEVFLADSGAQRASAVIFRRSFSST